MVLNLFCMKNNYTKYICKFFYVYMYISSLHFHLSHVKFFAYIYHKIYFPAAFVLYNI